MSEKQDDLAASVTIDPENPWLGLSSYTEETRAYFHGRDEEAAELARRVQRKNLTVLFGQSGLGKTSLLRAGLVPRLRNEGFCPVYVRVDYNPDSPPPSEQIKQAIFRATAAAGHWTRPGTAIEGESLWEFLHHRGDLLRDASGRTLLPLLIFDQFEEIFTLAQADDRGRLRAKQFLEDLADLVENRPPAALEARLDQDEAAAEDFDFARADYRILISLREDYLAHLESVKAIMPSITQNRMRLARMTGAQALSAVMQPGGRLVSQEVAESIVRFVAGGTELANAEVEPSLLSLVCRELNTVRIAQKRPEISADLLAGSRDTILTEFYERALADQPDGVRRVIEDELLTESGYRESLAEERVRKALDAAGAAPDALAKLVDRRLLRIEERLDMRRVELTHDVLCSVVASSRDRRHEREARDEAERRLAAQREREAATRRALVRARMIAAVCAVLAVLAAASAVFGYVATQRAKKADAQAQQARGDAEKLVGFLIEDFYAELEPTGRQETIGKLADQALKYFDGLPPELVTPQTQIYRGMALLRGGGAALAGDDIEHGNRKIDEAHALFQKLRDGGDKSAAVAHGLALSMFIPYSVWGVIGGPNSKPTDLPDAAALLKPYLTQPGTPVELKITYADILNHLSHSQKNMEQGVAMCDEARTLLEGIGALDLSNLTATGVYADTADSEARHALDLGRLEDADKLERQVYDLAEKVLARRPGDLRSMKNRALAANLLGEIAAARHDQVAAAQYAERATQAGEDAVRFNPSDLGTWQYWVMGRGQVAQRMFARGEVSAAIDEAKGTLALGKDERLPSSLQPILEDTWYQLASTEASFGRREDAERTFEGAVKASQEAAKQFAETNSVHVLSLARVPVRRARLELLLGDAQSAFNRASASAGNLERMPIAAADNFGIRVRDNVLQTALGIISASALVLERYPDAEKAARRRLELPVNPFDNPFADKAQRQVQLALALAYQGRAAEARTVLAPALEFYEREKKAGAQDTLFRRDYAEALLASALSQEPDAAGHAARKRALDAAAAELNGASTEARQLSAYRQIAARIAEARTPAGA
ncbi:MAG: hypothetical protein FIB04_14635 [Gammaproteobacteria bacterium]|nr:hypothetical protein [Gammaproteobacteria bacterium]